MPTLNPEIHYTSLINDLRTLITAGQQNATAVLNEIRLQTYWQMGKRLAAEKEIANADETTSGSFLRQVAADLEIDPSLAYRIVQFYKLWPKAIPRYEDTPALSWTHIVELLSISDNTERKFYFEEASKENWGRATLRKAIQKDFYITQNIVTVERSPLKRSENPMHVYKAVIENIVDGDTYLVRIDLGFNVWVNQRIRLRGINTPESKGEDAARAEQAKEFVKNKLSDVAFVVVKTYKTDLYGRYVVDLFYHPIIEDKEKVFAEGYFLNEEIYRAGFAELMIE